MIDKTPNQYYILPFMMAGVVGLIGNWASYGMAMNWWDVAIPGTAIGLGLLGLWRSRAARDRR